MTGDSTAEEFEPEARERLSSIETRQETIQDDVESLHDGQEKILDSLSDMSDEAADENALDELKEQAKKNTQFRHNSEAALKLVAVSLTIGGGFSGAAILLL